MDFFELIKMGSVEDLKLMLKADPSLVDSTNNRGFPPLILAAYYDQLEVAKLLILSGADINARDAAGNTALMGVCFKGFSGLAKLLINAGADINVQNYGGATALIYAASFGQQELVDMLILHGADRGLSDAKGNTAYSHAMMQGLIDVAERVKVEA